jgi:hypothetical protein
MQAKVIRGIETANLNRPDWKCIIVPVSQELGALSKLRSDYRIGFTDDHRDPFDMLGT